MARIRFAVLILPALLVSVSAADLTGRWKLSFKANWTSIPDVVCTLSQKDQRLEGTCRAGAADGKGVELKDGRVDADRVSWTWQVVVRDGVTWTYAFSGRLDTNGTAMNGIVTLTAGPGAKPNEASFTAQKE